MGKPERPRLVLIVAILASAIVVIALGAAVTLRSRTVVWGYEGPSAKALLEARLSPGEPRRELGTALLPWDAPDLTVRWVDPWRGGAEAFSFKYGDPKANGVWAIDLLGLAVSKSAGLRSGGRSIPTWESWLADLDRLARAGSGGPIPLAVSAKSDAELLAALLWMSDSLMAPEALSSALDELSKDPAGSLEPSGALPVAHPLRKGLDELREWARRGRLPADWRTYSADDAMRACVDGRAAYALVFSSTRFRLNAADSSLVTFGRAPVPPGRRSFDAIGNWLRIEEGPGWAAAAARRARLASLSDIPASQRLLRQDGLVLGDQAIPPVNAESRDVARAFHNAAFLFSAPIHGNELPKWKTLMNAVRAELMK